MTLGNETELITTQTEVKPNSKEKLMAHCIDCGHTWKPRGTPKEKPRLCSKCNSQNCEWVYIPESDLEPKTLDNLSLRTNVDVQTPSVSDVLREVLDDSVQVIDNPIDTLEEVGDTPTLAVWQNSEGKLSYGAIVNPDVLDEVNEILTERENQTVLAPAISDIEILKESGLIQPEKTGLKTTEVGGLEELEEIGDDEDVEELDSEWDMGKKIDEVINLPAPATEEPEKNQTTDGTGFSVSLTIIVIGITGLIALFIFALVRRHKQKREKEDKSVSRYSNSIVGNFGDEMRGALNRGEYIP